MSAAPSVDDTLGAVLIGTFISFVLYGLALHQAYEYYVNYSYDKRWLKIYVSIVLVLELACTILTMHICYYYAVSNFAKVSSLAYIAWSPLVLAIVGSIMIVLSQCFFLHRVWLIGRQFRPIVAIAAMFMMLELGVCFAYTVFGLRLKTWVDMAPKVWLVSVHNAASAVADLLVTGVLIYTLRQNQRRSMKRTNDMINDLILYAVSTGLVTGVYNVVCFIVSLTMPETLLYWATVLVGLKLYSNSLLAALNSRRSISARHPAGVTDTSPFGVSVRPGDSVELSRSTKATRHTVQTRHVEDSASDVLRDDDGDDPDASDLDLEGARSAEGTVLEVKITREVIRDSEPSRELDSKSKGDVESLGALGV